MPIDKRISDAELDLMEVLWAADEPLTAAEVVVHGGVVALAGTRRDLAERHVHASLGDQKLKNGDIAGGIEQMMHAIDEADTSISEKLFAGVIALVAGQRFGSSRGGSLDAPLNALGDTLREDLHDAVTRASFTGFPANAPFRSTRCRRRAPASTW